MFLFLLLNTLKISILYHFTLFLFHFFRLKAKYGNASIISSKRVVFNLKGNDYRLIVDIEYRLKIVFIVWFGTHNEYDKIDARTVRYEN
jgi:hypothetical protein